MRGCWWRGLIVSRCSFEYTFSWGVFLVDHQHVFTQVTALASVTLGRTRVFLSGGEETVIRVHKVRNWGDQYNFIHLLNELSFCPDDKQNQFEGGCCFARSSLQHPLPDSVALAIEASN